MELKMTDRNIGSSPVNMSIIGDITKPTNTWVCTYCGFHNVAHLTECELCGEEKEIKQ